MYCLPLLISLYILLQLNRNVQGYISIHNHRHTKQENGEAIRQQIQNTLEKDILRNTLSYLRSRLIDCIVTQNDTRRRRHISLEALEHIIDMDMLHNTQDFLFERLLQCETEKQLKSVHDKHSSKFKEAKMLKEVYGSSGNHIHKDTYTGSRNIYSGSQRLDDDNNIVWTERDTPTSQQESQVYQFEVDNKNVSCKEMYLLHSDNQTVICRDLWIENKLRFPNFHLCPEEYNPNDWVSIRDIGERTKQVLDLRSFCDVIGRELNIWAVVIGTKVVWNCDETMRRASYLKSKWSGYVQDNGYLHDLQCSFSAPINTVDIRAKLVYPV